MTEDKTNEIKYVLDGTLNIPEDLKTIKDYFRDCGNTEYQVCLVGKKESVKENLKDKNYTGKEFILLDDASILETYVFLPNRIKNAIRRINKLVSNPENDFNKTSLGIHALGLFSLVDLKALNDCGFGLSFWHGIEIFFNLRCKPECSGFPTPEERKACCEGSKV